MVLKHSRMTKEGNTILALWLVAGGAMSAAERLRKRQQSRACSPSPRTAPRVRGFAVILK